MRINLTAKMPNTKLAEQIIDLMAAKGLHLAIAESLTGGAIASALVAVAGCSRVLLGSVVAYDSAVKAAILGVDPELLARVGAVDRQVAMQMAAGARATMSAAAGLSADRVVAIACTGVAGPGAQDGKPAGLTYIAVHSAESANVHEFNFSGTRQDVRASTVRTSLRLLADNIDLRH